MRQEVYNRRIEGTNAASEASGPAADVLRDPRAYGVPWHGNAMSIQPELQGTINPALLMTGGEQTFLQTDVLAEDLTWERTNNSGSAMVTQVVEGYQHLRERDAPTVPHRAERDIQKKNEQKKAAYDDANTVRAYLKAVHGTSVPTQEKIKKYATPEAVFRRAYITPEAVFRRALDLNPRLKDLIDERSVLEEAQAWKALQKESQKKRKRDEAQVSETVPRKRQKIDELVRAYLRKYHSITIPYMVKGEILHSVEEILKYAKQEQLGLKLTEKSVKRKARAWKAAEEQDTRYESDGVQPGDDEDSHLLHTGPVPGLGTTTYEKRREQKKAAYDDANTVRAYLKAVHNISVQDKRRQYTNVGAVLKRALELGLNLEHVTKQSVLEEAQAWKARQQRNQKSVSDDEV